MVITPPHTHAQGQRQRTLSLKVGVETDGQTEAIALRPTLISYDLKCRASVNTRWMAARNIFL